MKAILLAAGKGTRISRMIKAVPKSTLPINGTPLINITANMLINKGIQPVVCVGYQHKKVQNSLKNLDIKYYYNPFYDITNSIASLWFAKEELNDDVLIINADVFFSNDILNKALSNKHDVMMMVDKTRTQTGDYFFSTTSNGCIRKYGKDLPLQVRDCEYVGIAKITKKFIPKFVDRLNELINKQQHQLWWENIIYSFTDHDEMDVFTVDVDGLFWSEIDYFDDYERILNYIDITAKEVKV
ncbi:phosphocholine cytidylyltransferase family protein [Herbinix luporum]|uniref:phosphocholine cytidylyltransferase family protein n=1 Tax=Herbinix luporum TaxID=1679721 RepID=UPI00176BB89E|nr:phosphocholine cytidylyltransferase family protein [Herbinix luporum]HHT57293.1 phosphocholine cytidylyltransferase family protein [Herbinix luporum]